MAWAKTTVRTTSSASPATARSMRWWRKPRSLCASGTRSAPSRSCAATRASVPSEELVAAAQASWLASSARCGRESPACAKRSTSATSSPRSKGSAQHIYENIYCQRGQMENLIKLHKTQLASDRMSCHSATANQVRLVLHTAAFWLMHGVRAAIPADEHACQGEFATIRERLIKIAARVIEHAARIRIQLPTSCPQGALFRRLRSVCCHRAPERRGCRPVEPPNEQINPERVARRVGLHRSRQTERRHASERLTCKKAPRNA